MEWLRSCYESDWRFDPQRELSRGKYVFAPGNSPHFKGLHYFGSRNWISDEREGQILGEVDGKQVYSNGAGPVPFPAALVAGDGDCVRDPRCNTRPITHEFTTFDASVPPFLGGKKGYRVFFQGPPSYQCSAIGPVPGLDRTMTGTWVLDFPVDTTVFWNVIGNTANSFCNTPPFFDCFHSLAIDDDAIAALGPTEDFTDCCFSPTQQQGGTWPVKRGRHVFHFTTRIQGQFIPKINVVWKFSFAPLGRQQYFRDGFPVECYLPEGCRPNFSPNDPDEWLRFADILQLSYTSMAAAEDALQVPYANAAFASVPNTSSVIPGSLIAWNECMTTVVIPGTTNYQQLCLQVLDPGVGFQNFGAYSTAVVWQNAYLAIASRLSATAADPTQPILCVGHSFGGVVAALLAANLKNFQPARDVRLLTYGMPRPGDIRVREALQDVPRAHLANVGDFVTGIPPTGPELLGLSTILPLALFNQWSQARIAGKQVVLTDDGQVFDDDASQLDFAQLAVLIFLIVNSLTVPPDLPHFISEYKRRLLLI